MKQFKQCHIHWKEFLKEAECPECAECASNVIAEVYYICKNGHKWEIPNQSRLKLKVINSNSSTSCDYTSIVYHCDSESSESSDEKKE